MRWMTTTLIILSASLSAGCSTLQLGRLDLSGATALPATDFCQLYERVYKREGDSTPVKAARPDVRRAIASNETKYLCVCKHWSNPICQKPVPGA